MTIQFHFNDGHEEIAGEALPLSLSPDPTVLFYPRLPAKLIKTGQQWTRILPLGTQELCDFPVTLGMECH